MVARLCQRQSSFTNVLSSSSGEAHSNADNKSHKNADKKSSNDWYNHPAVIAAAITAWVTLAASVGTLINWYFNTEFHALRKGKKALNCSFSIHDKPKTHKRIERKDTSAMLMNRLTHEHIRTLLVEGPRGSGKSTLVHMTLKEKPRVVTITLDPEQPFSRKYFAESVLCSLKVDPPSGVSPEKFVETLFGNCKGSLPIVAIEADIRCNGEQLQNLLLLLKRWGADLELIQPIVTLSSSRAAYGLTIDHRSLRTDIFTVHDLSAAESDEVLFLNCKQFVECTREEFSLFSEKLISRLGTRVLHLCDFTRVLKSLCHKKISLKELYEEGDKFIENLTQTYLNAIQAFREIVAGRDKSKQNAFNTLFECLKKEPLPLNYVTGTLGISNEEFIDLVASIQPHPFLVLFNNKMVYLDAEVEKAINL